MVTAKRIRTIRLYMGLTQEELGRLLGVHWVTVCRWETGKLVPSAFRCRLLTAFARIPFSVEESEMEGIVRSAPVDVALYWLLFASGAKDRLHAILKKKKRERGRG